MNKYLAIILASRDIGEFDRMYVMYTREAGLVRAVGKGVRKQAAKLAGHLEPGTFSEVYVARSKGIGQITSAITLNDFEKIKIDFEKISGALEIFHFFGIKFADGERDENIFELLKKFLEILSEVEEKYAQKISTEAFWWKLFDFLGHRPETVRCARCEGRLAQEKKKYFSVSRGGMICESCSGNENMILAIGSNQIKLLRVFLANPLKKILKVKVSEPELNGLARARKNFEKYNF